MCSRAAFLATYYRFHQKQERANHLLQRICQFLPAPMHQHRHPRVSYIFHSQP